MISVSANFFMKLYSDLLRGSSNVPLHNPKHCSSMIYYAKEVDQIF